jgi:hypothetical protein
MSEDRQHADIFTPKEAAVYLHLDPDAGERTLETLREKHGLQGFQIGRTLMYHRAQLDACINRMCGAPVVNGRGGR